MILFYIKETFRSINKAKLSSFFSLLTTCIAILLILFSYVSISFSEIIEQKLKERVIVNVFLKDKINSERITAVIKEIKDYSFVKSTKYISKKEAEAKFLQQSGEDFRKILEYNPLPASIEISLHPEFITPQFLSEISSNLKNIDDVDEVFYQNDFVYSLANSFSRIKIYLIIAAFILSAISFYLVYSTNRIIIHSRLTQLETMKLVGAKLFSIKFPIILNGLLIGFTASVVISSLVFSFRATNFYPKNADVYFDNIMFFVLVFISGPVIGGIGSYISARKISLKINKLRF